MIVRILLLAALLPACPPVSVVEPDPVPPAPDPAPQPTGSACARAAAHAYALKCTTDQAAYEEVCERNEKLAATSPAFAWNPECQVLAPDCAGIDRCRSGQ